MVKSLVGVVKLLLEIILPIIVLALAIAWLADDIIKSRPIHFG